MSSTISILILLIFRSVRSFPGNSPSLITDNNETDIVPQNNNCPPIKPILNAHIQPINRFGLFAVSITCHENYSLIGKHTIYCDDGDWSFGFDEDLPKCVKRCPPPPFLEHGEIELVKLHQDLFTPTGTYIEGTLAKYKCIEGYILEPSHNSIRTCENGQWTSTDFFCKLNMDVSCESPPVINKGYMQPNFAMGYAEITIGQEVLYQCVTGYRLIGSDKIKCSDRGFWVPEAPSCQKEDDLFPNLDCATGPPLDPKSHDKIEINFISSVTAQLSCQANYQNTLAPCQKSKFFCKNGKWIGVYPQCVEAHKCTAFPVVPDAVVVNQNFEVSYDSKGRPFCPINAEITYQCIKGYIMDGSPTINCQPNGCWGPQELWPSCISIRSNENHFIELNNLNAILISSGTGAAVLGILLLACLVVACKKRRALTRAISVPASESSLSNRHAPDVVNDHAVLLQHPDRLALIAFADGNNTLPSYEEATRDRSTLIQVSRLQIQRPHWPNLVICRGSTRSRGSPNIDSGHHVTRHGSFASHTPSMRSGGESMGSTDTVTISEGSTNVTLDTASSHSAISQNPSCRAHCGSLASFDGCSIVNTEGVPLLEESELEEIQGGTNDIDNPAVSDNISSKISTHSAPLTSN